MTDGAFYEDFEVGHIYRHALGKTVTESDNNLFTMLTLNTQQSHFNIEYARRLEFGQILVNSTYTLALITGLTVSDISQNVIANLGWDAVQLPHPVFIGDTLWAETIVLSKRESQSRPNAGIVTVKTRGLNQHGKEVITFKRTILVHKRSAAESISAFPEPERPIQTEDA
ncbi:MAG TPA: MaoC family dehydratase [Candidatus Dormibacteraeota bacterium]|nr:MaoC family dehydratase [Candidatus Dormibacteraeota bacterium]